MANYIFKIIGILVQTNFLQTTCRHKTIDAVKFPDFENFSRSFELNVKSPELFSAVKSPER